MVRSNSHEMGEYVRLEAVDEFQFRGFGNNLITPYVSINNAITQKIEPTVDIRDFVMSFSPSAI